MIFALGGFIINQIGRRGYTEGMSKGEFVNLVNQDNVEMVVIKQNSQTPSGSAQIEFTDSSLSREYYVSDVNKLVHLLDEKNIDYVMKDIEKNNSVTGIVIPIALTLASILFVFMLIIYFFL